MLYLVLRNGQTYGPYTLEDLRRYVATGNVLLSDLAQPQPAPGAAPDSSAPTTSVADLLGTQTSTAVPPPSASFAPGGMAFAAPLAASPFPPPPNLNWIVLLLLGLFTGGLFTLIYELVQASWLRRVLPSSRVLLLYLVADAFWLVNISVSVGNAVAVVVHHTAGSRGIAGGIASLLYLVFLLVARFTMRSELEQHFNSAEPIGLRLSGVMTFFFGSLYFQYHFNRINELRAASAFGAGLPPR